MTTADWCVLAAALLPYAFTIAAKSQRGFDNARPREYLANLQGWRQRAHWAQLNGFEVFAPFAAAVLIAQQVGAEQTWINGMAIVFVLSRIAYGLCYIVDRATLRSLAWTLGLACIIGLFVVSA